MDLLGRTSILVIATVLIAHGLASSSHAAVAKWPDTVADSVDKAKRQLCASTEEYIKTLKFLQEAKEYSFRQDLIRDIADKVSRGCDGASDRFAQILVLLKTIGLSERKSIDMALEFAAAHPDTQKNFLEVFTKSFLKEFFDFEFSKALYVALELSKDYKGNPAIAREDFIELAHFCKSSKKLGLPMPFCSEYTVRVAKLSQYYQDGIRKPFQDVFQALRERREFSLDVRVALEFTYGILKYGPKSPDNFFAAYKFATGELQMDKRKALEFSLNLASHSFIGETPPIMQFTVDETSRP